MGERSTATSAALTAAERTELLDWVSSCQSAYHIDSTPGHRFGGLPSALEENRQALCDYVEGLLASRVRVELAKSAGARAFEGWKLMPPRLTGDMRVAMVVAALRYMRATGGYSPEVMYEAAFEAAPTSE